MMRVCVAFYRSSSISKLKKPWLWWSMAKFTSICDPLIANCHFLLINSNWWTDFVWLPIDYQLIDANQSHLTNYRLISIGRLLFRSSIFPLIYLETPGNDWCTVHKLLCSLANSMQFPISLITVNYTVNHMRNYILFIIK